MKNASKLRQELQDLLQEGRGHTDMEYGLLLALVAVSALLTATVLIGYADGAFPGLEQLLSQGRIGVSS